MEKGLVALILLGAVVTGLGEFFNAFVYQCQEKSGCKAVRYADKKPVTFEQGDLLSNGGEFNFKTRDGWVKLPLIGF